MRAFMPRLDPHLRQTFRIAQPPATHTRKATCTEVDCPEQEHGWRMLIDESTQIGQVRAHYIRRESGRRCTEDRTPEGLTEFTFPAGQRCFAEHRVNLERPALFVVVGGDHRGNPRKEGTRHSGPDAWMDHLHTHLDTLTGAQG